MIKILIVLLTIFWYICISAHNVILLHRINKAKEFIEKNIELNNSFLPNAEGPLIHVHDLIKNENDILNCLKKMLEGEV